LTPNVTPIGPWPLEVSTAAPVDNMLFFVADPNTTSVMLYDTIIEAAFAEVQGLSHGADLFALWFLP
jgi:hypothetical protein